MALIYSRMVLPYAPLIPLLLLAEGVGRLCS